MPKDQDKKKRVKRRAIERAPEKNTEEFNRLINDIRMDRSQTYCICRVEKLEGTGVFKLVSKEGREYFGDCPGNLALSSMIGQIAKHTTLAVELQPLVLVLLPSIGASKQKPEILALITDEINKSVTKLRLDILDDLGLKFYFNKEEDLFEAEVDIEDL